MRTFVRKVEDVLAEAYRKHFDEPGDVLHVVTIRTRRKKSTG